MFRMVVLCLALITIGGLLGMFFIEVLLVGYILLRGDSGLLLISKSRLFVLLFDKILVTVSDDVFFLLAGCFDYYFLPFVLFQSCTLFGHLCCCSSPSLFSVCGLLYGSL